MFHFSADPLRSRCSLVEVQQPVQPRPAPHPPPDIDHKRARDQPIAEPLMIPFSVIVLDVLRHRAPEVPLPDRHDPSQALFFDGSDEALGVRIGIGRPLGNQHHMNTGLAEPTPDIVAPFPIPIADHDSRASTTPASAIVSVRTTCCMNSPSGCGVDSTEGVGSPRG
jgi:hypothetical protein